MSHVPLVAAILVRLAVPVPAALPAAQEAEMPPTEPTARATQPARPFVIAHRGASGYLPEHTLPAYALAYAMGADFIEPDLALTNDGVLLASHDVTLERTTNVEEVFPDRARPDGRWYVIDFTIEEIRTLAVDGPRRFVEPEHGTEEPPESETEPKPVRAVPSGLRKATLGEVIELVQHLNRQTGRSVGIIPEIKQPAFHVVEGKPIEGPLAEVLAEYGYTDPGSGAIIQSFDADSLRRLRQQHGVRVPLVYLVDRDDPFDLDDVRTFAEGLGPHRELIERSSGRLVEDAHARGLFVTPWTFQGDVEEMARFFSDYGVDGLFTDFPDRAAEARAATGHR